MAATIDLHSSATRYDEIRPGPLTCSSMATAGRQMLTFVEEFGDSVGDDPFTLHERPGA